MKKEIIFSSYDSLKNPFYAGGGALAIHSIAKRLTANFRITVLTASFNGSKNYILDGVRYEHISLPFLGPQVGQLFFQIILPFYVISKRFDCWIESFTPPFSTSFLQLYTKKPVIGLVHMLSAEDMYRKYKLPFPLIESIGLKTYNNFIVLSENAKNQILDKNKDANILLTTNGVDIPENLEPYSKRDQSYLLFIGRIEVNQKGLDILLSAYKKVLKTYSVKLKIAGTGSPNEVETLNDLIKVNGLEKNVELLGRVGGVEKSETISHSTVIIVSSRFETFSIAALEAISYGIPLVCFDIKGMSWIPKEMVERAKSFSDISLAEKISKLLDNRVLRSNISKLQIDKSKKYAWDDIARKYEDYIYKLIKGNE